MNDNNLRGAQWQRLVAEFYVPLLGGAAHAWAEANRVVAEGMLTPDAWSKRLQEAADYLSFDRAYQLHWLGGMCEMVGVPLPDEDEAVALAHQATLYVTSR